MNPPALRWSEQMQMTAWGSQNMPGETTRMRCTAAGSVTQTKAQGWALAPVGAQIAAFKISRKLCISSARSENRRTLLRSKMAFSTSTKK